MGLFKELLQAYRMVYRQFKAEGRGEMSGFHATLWFKTYNIELMDFVRPMDLIRWGMGRKLIRIIKEACK